MADGMNQRGLRSIFENDQFSSKQGIKNWVESMEPATTHSMLLENFDPARFDPDIHNPDHRPIKQLIVKRFENGTYGLFLSRKKLEADEGLMPEKCYSRDEINSFLEDHVKTIVEDSILDENVVHDHCYGPYSAEQVTTLATAFDMMNYMWELVNRANSMQPSTAALSDTDTGMSYSDTPVDIILREHNMDAEKIAQSLVSEAHRQGIKDYTAEDARNYTYGTMANHILEIAKEEFNVLKHTAPSPDAVAMVKDAAAALKTEPGNTAGPESNDSTPWWRKFDKPAKDFDPHTVRPPSSIRRHNPDL